MISSRLVIAVLFAVCSVVITASPLSVNKREDNAQWAHKNGPGSGADGVQGLKKRSMSWLVFLLDQYVCILTRS
ncbi:hypothetical protein NEOLEDRAFT_744562 [Neolentinus lepideus HHB14362 ss-1]|uniref:Uncharacterized protein n=1 Tax=Neolentinus lepideus HHB14362 ss-1 TaxID=1314782 RepID=A0A165PXJ0_9AGAM|nr:hypothetical protein NEOLEDRAFT_744562 [Neolentinus lepideus HHB14362 ss-1]